MLVGPALLLLYFWGHSYSVHDRWAWLYENQKTAKVIQFRVKSSAGRIRLFHQIMRSYGTIDTSRPPLRRFQYAASPTTEKGSGLLAFSHRYERSEFQDHGRVVVSTSEFSVPHWLPIVLFLAWPLVRLRRTIKSRIQKRRAETRNLRTMEIPKRVSSRCLNIDCGYDIRASPHYCPECGRDTTKHPYHNPVIPVIEPYPTIKYRIRPFNWRIPVVIASAILTIISIYLIYCSLVEA